MAIGGAIVSVVMGLASMSQQQQAAERARDAGNEGARSIMEETSENISQARKSQAQTLGIAKAVTAASGIKFDATKISAVEFTEGGTRTRTVGGKMDDVGNIVNASIAGFKGFDPLGGGIAESLFGGGGGRKGPSTYEEELTAGEQIAGEETGGSAFTYLREMKKTFAENIGYIGKQGRSRARVASMGGQVAYAQGQATATQTAASTYQQAYSWWKES